jgi:hypothetical protein
MRKMLKEYRNAGKERGKREVKAGAAERNKTNKTRKIDESTNLLRGKLITRKKGKRHQNKRKRGDGTGRRMNQRREKAEKEKRTTANRKLLYSNTVIYTVL